MTAIVMKKAVLNITGSSFQLSSGPLDPPPEANRGVYIHMAPPQSTFDYTTNPPPPSNILTVLGTALGKPDSKLPAVWRDLPLIRTGIFAYITAAPPPPPYYNIRIEGVSVSESTTVSVLFFLFFFFIF